MPLNLSAHSLRKESNDHTRKESCSQKARRSQGVTVKNGCITFFPAAPAKACENLQAKAGNNALNLVMEA